MVMIITSRFFTCVSSWAMTASSSCGSSMFIRPVVAHTVAVFCERPMAKAFGIGVSATAIFGLGRSAWMQSRSIIACRPGACSGVTSFAPIAARPSLSETKNCPIRRPPAITAIITPLAPAGEQHAHEDHVEEAQQEDRQEHPGLKPRVTTEFNALTCHLQERL